MMAAPRYLIAPEDCAEGLYCDGNDERRGDSGVDLRFPADCEIPPTEALDGRPFMVDLQVRVRCLAWGYYAPFTIVPRSSIAKTPLSLANSIGIVDQGYTGTLRVAIRNHSKSPYPVKRGDSLFQLVRPGMEHTSVQVVTAQNPAFAPDASQRGGGGFGSTGASGSGSGAGSAGSV